MGFIYYNEYEPEAFLYVAELDILPAHQGLGLGRLALYAALQDADAIDLEVAMLDVAHCNHRAERFYENAGFARTGRNMPSVDNFPIRFEMGGRVQNSLHILGSSLRRSGIKRVG